MGELKTARLIFMSFTEEMIARNILEMVKGAKDGKTKSITVADWALVLKDADGKVSITTDKSVDPGAARGALAGGGFGMILAALTGPIGVAAVVGGAAIGAVAAAHKDSGLQSRDLEAASTFMVDGRSGLVIAIPLDDVERWNDFVTDNVEFEAAIRRYEVDITPDHTFAAALAEYRQHQEA